ncbi:unnamed protein product [Closterium sp. NIES-64]|nr:unnamed protein product [Closterium sp. NIES-64]
MTMLQKMCELMEYTDLLNKADSTDDPNMRMVYTAAWAVSPYVAFSRTWKPFNPILGETFEFSNHNGITFVNEQVSHHPPICAGHGENEHFVYDCTSKVWRLTDLPEDDKFQFTHFARKLNSFETAPPSLLPSDSRLRPDRKALEEGDLNQSASEKYRLEEHQRAEKREREQRKDAFVPKWFRSSGETAVTPWGDLEVYEFTGLYDERKSAASETPVEDVPKQEFSPWQYPELKVEVQDSPVPTGVVAL